MIKNLTENDFNEFCSIRLKSLEQYPVAYSSMPQFFRKASDETKMNLLIESADGSSNFIKGFYCKNVLTGIIGLKRESRESVSHKGTMWGFYVDPEFQNQGQGKALLKSFIEDVMLDRRLRYVRLMVSDDCKAAINLFKKHEFKQYGIEESSISDGINFYDQIYMRLNCT